MEHPNRAQLWSDFVEHMMQNTMTNYRKTQEFDYYNQIMEHINSMLETNLTKDQKEMIEEVLSKFYEFRDREAEILYIQGMRDGVSILKNLEVL